MDAAFLHSLEEAVKASAPVLGALGGPVALFAWWTSRTTQFFQNRKTVLDVLQAAETTTADPGYKKFVEDLRKEKLVALAFGCAVRPEEFGRLMAYYDQGLATTTEIRLAWNYRNGFGKPLSFQPNLFEDIFLVFVVCYALACGLAGMAATVLLFSLPAGTAQSIASYPLGFFLLAGLTLAVFRGQLTAAMLGRREKRHLRQQRKVSAADHG